MKQELDLQVVRKQKAKKSHLAVPAPPDADISTLCGVAMKRGEYEVLDAPADCTPCLRKQHNRAFISSAYFAQDAGGRLLEMSLKASGSGRPRRKNRGRPARPQAPADGPKREATHPKKAALDGPGEGELAELGLAQLKRVGPLVYQSPAGALVRVQKRSGGWTIAEVSFDGPGSLLARSSGRTSFRLGDLEVDPGADATRVSLKPGR